MVSQSELQFRKQQSNLTEQQARKLAGDLRGIPTSDLRRAGFSDNDLNFIRAFESAGAKTARFDVVRLRKSRLGLRQRAQFVKQRLTKLKPSVSDAKPDLVSERKKAERLISKEVPKRKSFQQILGSRLSSAVSREFTKDELKQVETAQDPVKAVAAIRKQRERFEAAGKQRLDVFLKASTEKPTSQKDIVQLRKAIDTQVNRINLNTDIKDLSSKLNVSQNSIKSEAKKLFVNVITGNKVELIKTGGKIVGYTAFRLLGETVKFIVNPKGKDNVNFITDNIASVSIQGAFNYGKGLRNRFNRGVDNPLRQDLTKIARTSLTAGVNVSKFIVRHPLESALLVSIALNITAAAFLRNPVQRTTEAILILNTRGVLALGSKTIKKLTNRLFSTQAARSKVNIKELNKLFGKDAQVVATSFLLKKDIPKFDIEVNKKDLIKQAERRLKDKIKELNIQILKPSVNKNKIKSIRNQGQLLLNAASKFKTKFPTKSKLQQALDNAPAIITVKVKEITPLNQIRRINVTKSQNLNKIKQLVFDNRFESNFNKLIREANKKLDIVDKKIRIRESKAIRVILRKGKLISKKDIDVDIIGKTKKKLLTKKEKGKVKGKVKKVKIDLLTPEQLKKAKQQSKIIEFELSQGRINQVVEKVNKNISLFRNKKGQAQFKPLFKSGFKKQFKKQNRSTKIIIDKSINRFKRPVARFKDASKNKQLQLQFNKQKLKSKNILKEELKVLQKDKSLLAKVLSLGLLTRLEFKLISSQVNTQLNKLKNILDKVNATKLKIPKKPRVPKKPKAPRITRVPKIPKPPITRKKLKPIRKAPPVRKPIRPKTKIRLPRFKLRKLKRGEIFLARAFIIVKGRRKFLTRGTVPIKRAIDKGIRGVTLERKGLNKFGIKIVGIRKGKDSGVGNLRGFKRTFTKDTGVREYIKIKR